MRRHLTAAASVLALTLTTADPQRAQAAWSPDAELAGEVVSSRSAIDARGNAVVIWERFTGSGQRNIEIRRRLATGALGPVSVLEERAPATSDTAVAMDRDGDAMLMWSGAGVRARSLSAAGELGPILQLASPDESATDPEVAVGSDGTIAFAWQREADVRARILSRAGALGPTRDVFVERSDRTVLDERAMQLAVAASGTATLVWDSAFAGIRSVVRSRSLTAAGVLRHTRRLSRGRSATDPQVASLPDGSTAFAWVDTNGVRARLRSAEGKLRGAVELFGEGFEHPRLGSLPPRGKVLVAANGASGLRARSLSARLRRGPALRIAAPPLNAFAMGVRPNGAAQFVWSRGSLRNQGLVLQARSRASNGKLGPTVRVARDCVADLQLVVGARGPALATWLGGCGNMPGFPLRFSSGP